MVRWIVLLAVVAVLGALAASTALAMVGEIDHIAKLQGKVVVVTGPMTCEKGATVTVRLTVTQRSTGALAEGRWRKTCTGARQHWTIRATGSAPAFRPGAAEACALGRTVAGGKPTDAHQWCAALKLARTTS